MTELQAIIIILGFIFLANVIGIGIISGQIDALITLVQQLEMDILRGNADEQIH